jgi:hypothetical protein
LSDEVNADVDHRPRHDGAESPADPSYLLTRPPVTRHGTSGPPAARVLDAASRSVRTWTERLGVAGRVDDEVQKLSQTLDFTQPIALMLLGIRGHIPSTTRRGGSGWGGHHAAMAPRHGSMDDQPQLAVMCGGGRKAVILSCPCPSGRGCASQAR